MKKPEQLWIYLRSSFWFVPSLIVAGSIILAVGLIEADSVIDNGTLARWPRLFGAGPEGARQMLSTIAGSMMSVVGVTFSMILVVLALVSSRYTSRVLGNFMCSRLTQAVLGIFAGIFTYRLIVLRPIRDSDGMVLVPSLAVLCGLKSTLARDQRHDDGYDVRRLSRGHPVALASQHFSSQRYDEEGELRLITISPTLATPLF